jgi:putative two-component system response regulator
VTNDSSEVVALCAELQPDLVVLDLQMPSPDGFEVMALLRPWITGRSRLPILVVTADVTPETKRRALAAGAQDFLTKPFDFEEIRLRVANLLQTRRLQEDLRRYGELLEDRVRERTREADAARIEIVQRLAAAAEYRDDATGQHTRRVARTAGLLAAELALPDHTVRLITLAAPLHDVGKIAIPDSVLLKPGRLTNPQFELMKMHVERGAKILGGSSSPLLQQAEEIALTHHERWDGAGYLSGLREEEIPLAGRLVAIADVFDALTHDRPYKKAWTVQQAVQEICSHAGTQFDPQVIEVFAGLNHAALVAPVERPDPLSDHAGLDALAESRAKPAQKRDPAIPSASDAPAVADSPAHESAGPPAEPGITLSEAADALDVSPSTLRRWADAGRIVALRTAGGHRRFAVSEVRRLRSTTGEHADVAPVRPPSLPLPGLGKFVATSGQDLADQAAKTVYAGPPGWWALETSRAQVEAWLQSLAGALHTGNYDVALQATKRLMRQAELAGTTQLEQHVFIERFSELTVRRLIQGRFGQAEVSGLRRLFASLRHSLLESATAT